MKKEDSVNEIKDMEIPEGLGFQMALNQSAMKTFSNMTVEEKSKIIEESKQVKTKQEMTDIIDKLS